MSMQAEKRCELCGAYLASDNLDSRFCSPCRERLGNLGLTEERDIPRFCGVEEYAADHLMNPEQVRRRWLIPREDVTPPLGQPEVKEGLKAFHQPSARRIRWQAAPADIGLYT